MSDFKTHFNEFNVITLFQANTLNTLDQYFLTDLCRYNAVLYSDLLAYRHQNQNFTPVQISELLLECAKVLEQFIAHFFNIQKPLAIQCQETRQHDSIFVFKKWFVLRRARRRLAKKEPLEGFAELDRWLTDQLSNRLTEKDDRELAVAQLANDYLADKETYIDEIEKLTRWCIRALTTPEGQRTVRDWVSFKLPQLVNPTHLVATVPVPNDSKGRLEGPYTTRYQREGFKLTDPRMSIREVKN